MSITIRDVAKHADVSVATVSRALRGHSSVSAATRERVEKAAAQLDYTLPYRPEINTHRRSSRTAVVMPYIGRWYFARVLEGIESVLGDRDGDLIIVRPFDRQGRRRNLLDLIAPGDVDAAILVALPAQDSEVLALQERGIGLSLLGSTHPRISNVTIDDTDTGRQATEHLISLGHTRIGLVSGAPFEPMAFTVATNRRKGFLTALANANIAWDPTLEVHADFTIRGAQRGVDRLLSLENPPTAIVAESDEMAFGVIAAARSHGLRVPEDLSVVGVDDHDVSEAWDLTTMAQPTQALGEVAAWQALSRSEQPASVIMPTSLIVRGSTAPPAD